MTKYIYKGKGYTNLFTLRKAMPNVGIPSSVTEAQLNKLGVTVEAVEQTAEEIAAQELTMLDLKYEKLIASKEDEIIRATIIYDDADMVSELKEELNALYEEYDSKREAL